MLSPPPPPLFKNSHFFTILVITNYLIKPINFCPPHFIKIQLSFWWNTEIIPLQCRQDMVLIVSPLLDRLNLINMCNTKSIVNIRINPFQISVLNHKYCPTHRITCGTKLLLLTSFNPRTKYPHLYIIRLGRIQRINDIIEKYIHLYNLEDHCHSTTFCKR